MRFTEEEVVKLRKRYSKDIGFVVDDNGVFLSTNQGFGYQNISKHENGDVVETWSTPGSVDPDDGKVGWYNNGSKVYASVDDLLKGKAKFSKKNHLD